MDWEAVINQHGAALVLYARQWTSSHADAEEVVQDGILKLWRSGKMDNLPEDLIAPWMYKTVKRTALDRWRSARRRQQRETLAGETLYEPIVGLNGNLEREERRQAIETALNALPPEQREVLVMKIWSELTFKQIGEALGISLNTAASRYRYALAALKRALAPEVSYAG